MLIFVVVPLVVSRKYQIMNENENENEVPIK